MEKITVTQKKSKLIHLIHALLKGVPAKGRSIFMYQFTLYVKNKNACNYSLEVMG